MDMRFIVEVSVLEMGGAQFERNRRGQLARRRRSSERGVKKAVAFPCAWLPDARNAFPAVDFIESLNVVELDDSGMPVVREVDARIVL